MNIFMREYNFSRIYDAGKRLVKYCLVAGGLGLVLGGVGCAISQPLNTNQDYLHIREVKKETSDLEIRVAPSMGKSLSK